MKWAALGLGTAVAATSLAWVLVTTGHWPLDDRKQPATGLYALNGALGQWLLDHGGEAPQGPGWPARPPGDPGSGGAASGGLTPSELAVAQEALRTDPQFRGRYRFTPAPAGGPGRG
jgi:hypothetical protein